jgi:hypothetical protein
MKLIISLCAAMAFTTGSARAASSGNAAKVGGAAQANIIAPAAMTNTGALRFGQFVQPTAAGTLVLTPAGALSATGGVAGNQLIAQTSGGPAPGTFQITSNANQAFTVYAPTSLTLTNGGSAMTLNNMTGTLVQIAGSSTTTIYALAVGGTLNVGANQALGTYAGTYTLTTVYQ